MTKTDEMLEELIGHVHACCKWLESIDSKLANQSSGVSSVNIKTSTRGHDIDVKAYTGSPITEAGDTAVAEYFRVAREIEARLMGQA